MIQRKKCVVFVVMAMIFAVSVAIGAVDTTNIDLVRQKDELTEEDLRVIDSFIADSLAEMLNSEDTSELVAVRVAVVSRRNSNQESAKEQYADNFIASAKRHLASRLKQAREISPAKRQSGIILNLLILLDNLQGDELVESALGFLNDNNAAIRYWATHAVTNPAITEKLNSIAGSSPRLAQTITQRLKERVDKESSPEILALFVDFCAAMESADARQLLLEIADMRIKKYADWSVDYELLDIAVLKGLGDKIKAISSASDEKAALGRRFAQLYSYVMQRYLKGRDYLPVGSKQQLISVLVEVEQWTLAKLLGVRQSSIKTALEKKKFVTLSAEHDSLFGTESRTGRLAEAIEFDYSGPGSPRRTAPEILPDPPKAPE